MSLKLFLTLFLVLHSVRAGQMGMDFTFRNPVSGPCLLFFSSLSFSSLWEAQEMKCFLSVFAVLIGERGPDVLAVVGGPVLSAEGRRRWRAFSGVSVQGETRQPRAPCPPVEVLTYRFGISHLPCLLVTARLPASPVPADSSHWRPSSRTTASLPFLICLPDLGSWDPSEIFHCC